MAGRAMQCSIIMGDRWIVVRAHRIAGTEALSFQGGLEEPNEAPRHLDETTQRSLIAGSGRVDQNSALGWLPLSWKPPAKTTLSSPRPTVCRVCCRCPHPTRGRIWKS